MENVCMKHEIEIEGLPEGWRAVAYRIALRGVDHVLRNGKVTIYNGFSDDENLLIVEKIMPHRIVLEETGRWHINSTEGYVLVPAGSLIDMIDIEESQPDWMCYKVVEEE